MAIVFKCECGRGFKVPDEAAGKKVKCKDCGEPVRVPAAKPTKQKVAASAPTDEDDYGMDFGLKADDVPTELPPRKSDLQDYTPSKRNSGSGSRKKKQKGGMNPAVIGVGVLALVGVAAGGFFALKNFTGGPAKPLVVDYAKFSHERGGFSIDYPTNWEQESSEVNNSNVGPWATFKDGTAYVSMKSSLKGAAIGDIANSSFGGLSDAGDAEQAEAESLKTLHDNLTNMQFSNDYSDYEETPGEMVRVPYGTGWLVEFSGGEAFSGKQRGYRLTLKGSALQQYTVLCKVPNNRWDDYEPIFKKIIDSVGRAESE